MVVSLGGIVLDQTTSGISTASVNFIQGSFALTPDEGSWVLTAFNAAYYTSTVVSAWMQSRFGRKRVFIGGLLSFALFSWLCAFAWNAEALVVLRALQGFALGSVFVPALVNILVSVSPKKIGYAFLPFTFTTVAASTIGLMLGGIFVQYAQWQDVFACISIFAVVLAVVAAFTLLSDEGKRRPFDPVGIGLLFVAFVTFQYVVNEGERRDYFNDTGITVAAVMMLASIVAFVVWKLHLSRYPFFNLRLLGRLGLTLAAICAGLLSVAQYSGNVLVQYSQVAGTHFSPTDAGALFALRIVTLLVGIAGVGLLVIRRHVNPRLAMSVALVAFAGFTLLQADRMTSTADFNAFIGIELLLGVAQGAANQPLPAFIFSQTSRHELPLGAVVYKLARSLGTAIAGAIADRFVEVHSAQNLSDIAGTISLSRPNVASFVMQHANIHTLAASVNVEATVIAFDDLTRIFGILMLVLIPIFYFIPLPKQRRSSG